MLGCFGSCFSSVCVDFQFFSIFIVFLGCFRLLCAVYIFHIVVVSSCCPVGCVCFRLLSFLVSGAFLSFVVFVVLGCSSLFLRLFQG